MTHYRQILVNILVEDDVSEELLKELTKQLKMCIEDNTNINEIRDIQVVLN